MFPLGSLSKPTGGGSVSWELPRSGLLGAIHITIRGQITGTLSNQNPLGMASIIRRVRLSLNNGYDVINISGAGYVYLLSDMLNDYRNVLNANNGRAAVSATNFNLDMLLPVAFNIRDAIGLIPLQNVQTLATLIIDWEADATVASGATVTGSATPTLWIFELPADPKDYPPLNVLHLTIEDSQAAASAGEQTYAWPLGNVYTGVYHLITGTTWTRAVLRAQQSVTWYDFTPTTHSLWFETLVGRGVSLTGALTGDDRRIFFDLAGSDGLGTFGTERDSVNSANYTDLSSLITTAGAGTIRTVRRSLAYLR
ncbi:MAG: hypothetical protein QXT45_07055 [Candidatus Bilamarchaeaceae archaeon]